MLAKGRQNGGAPKEEASASAAAVLPYDGTAAVQRYLSASPSSWKLHGGKGNTRVRCCALVVQTLVLPHTQQHAARSGAPTPVLQGHRISSNNAHPHQPVSHTVASVDTAPASAGGAGHSSAAAACQVAPHRPTTAPMSGNHITAGGGAGIGALVGYTESWKQLTHMHGGSGSKQADLPFTERRHAAGMQRHPQAAHWRA